MGRLAGVLGRHPRLRWAAPAAAIAVVAGIGVVVADAASADDHPVLPAITAEQLLTDALQPTAQSLSGTVALSADLGLPELPGLTGAVTGTGVVPGSAATLAPVASPLASSPAVSGLTALLSGDHTLRVWADGPDRSRVAVIADGEESDVVRNGTDLWVWHSAGQQALHATLPSRASLAAHGDATPPDLAALLGQDASSLAQLPTTPQQAAAMFLAAAGPSTDVATDSTASVAGRPAYRLVATPKDPGSLVARVVVAIDATTHVPLRVDVYSTQRTDPAFSVGFTDVSFAAPAAGVFAFTPPAGATVEQWQPAATVPAAPARTGAHPDVTTVGTGWATVLVATPPAGAGHSSAMLGQPAGTTGGVLDALPRVSGDWGSGRTLTGTLFSVLVTDDGTFAAGAVPVEALEDAVAHAGTSGTGQ
ncbi:MAG TPA: hypothetical protein VGC04_00285 [Cellulomonas sp.]